MRVLIIGAGGHGQVVADILLRAGDMGGDQHPIGFIDDDPGLTGAEILGLPVVGSFVQLSLIPHDAVIVAVGDNARRRRLYEQCRQQGERFAVACHPSAIVARDVQIGQGVMICAGVIVNPGSVIGENTILNTGCTVDHHNIIGDHTHIAPGVHLGGAVRIGAGVLLGIGSTVLPGRRVGDGGIVGAGALVVHNVLDREVVVGIPARLLKTETRS